MFFLISKRRKYLIIGIFRQYLRDPKFKGLFKSKEIREKRKKLGKIFFEIFFILGIFFVILAPLNWLIALIFLTVSFVFVHLASHTYIKAIQDEVLEEFMLEREKPTFKDFCEREIREKRRKLISSSIICCAGYILFVILYVFFPRPNTILAFVEVSFLLVGIDYSTLVGYLFIYIKFLKEEIMVQRKNQKIKSQQ